MPRLPKSFSIILSVLGLNAKQDECEHKWANSHELPAMYLSVFFDFGFMVFRFFILLVYFVLPLLFKI